LLFPLFLFIRCGEAVDRGKMVDRQSTLHNLLGKLSDPDPDIRYMSLNDVFGILTSPNSLFLLNDNATSAKLSDGLLKALEDQHGEVQNQALKWYYFCINLTFKKFPNIGVLVLAL
jgi:hypothetical protein